MIGEHELLYRRIPNLPHYFAMYDGTLRLSKAAFSDAGGQPSVDRAAMLLHSPARALTQPDQGIVGLTVGEVRALQVLSPQRDDGEPPVVHRIDVAAAPSHDNPAHALIMATPPLSKAPFARLKENLARVAEQRGWLLDPTSTPSPS